MVGDLPPGCTMIPRTDESKSTNTSKDPCPLCGCRDTGLFYTSRDEAQGRDFLQCPACDLVFVPKRFHIDQEAQRQRYLTHNNDPDDKGYRDFLSRLFDPLRPNLRRGARGLDYGAGPGPALVKMMRESGFDIRMYDPYFSPDKTALARHYDFITCTETAEHFADPQADFDTFQALLTSPGWLGLMTGMLDTWRDFPDWYYHRDPTHICFYSKHTMSWIARRYCWEPSFPRQNVVLFHKPA